MAASVFFRRVSYQLPRFPRPLLENPASSFLFPHGASAPPPTLPLEEGLGPMELMAVPRKKVSRHKKGLRNGPKALKPVPVIVRCKSCGRVKLPHFYCCSGDRGNSGTSS